MADLDNFFAKKDKKKAKSKPKFLTTDELIKNLEDTSKREVAAKSKNPEPNLAVISDVQPSETNSNADEDKSSTAVEQLPEPQSVEEEWKEFEEEQRKDYSGLKIGRLTLDDDDERSQTEGDEDDGDNDVNMGHDMRRGGDFPWKKVIPAEEVTQIPVEVEKTPKTPKTYVLPALRNSQGPGSLRTVKTRNRTAPDITNADFFPTLGAARPEEQRKKKQEPAFEEVRHGSRVQRIKEQPAPPAAVTNRFQSLEEADS